MNEQDRKDLRIQALLEKISKITTTYEATESEFRVELTVITNERNDFANQCAQLREEVDSLRKQLEPVGAGENSETQEEN